MAHNVVDNASAALALAEQGSLPPGDSGWWEVWGARASDACVGDILLSKGGHTDFVTGTFEAKSIVRVGLVSDGERFTIGMGAPIILLRWGTHNTLVD